jgi:hypothetical protein
MRTSDADHMACRAVDIAHVVFPIYPISVRCRTRHCGQADNQRPSCEPTGASDERFGHGMIHQVIVFRPRHSSGAP